MHKQWKDKGLVILTVTTDEPEDKPQVLAFLKKHEANFRNLLIKDTEANAKKYDEKYPVDPQPMLWLFNKKGERVVKDTGKLKDDDVEKKVQELLKE
jgi:hypothetical protein